MCVIVLSLCLFIWRAVDMFAIAISMMNVNVITMFISITNTISSSLVLL